MLTSSKASYPINDEIVTLRDSVPMVLCFGVASSREIAWAYGMSRAQVIRAWKRAYYFVEVQ